MAARVGDLELIAGQQAEQEPKPQPQRKPAPQTTGSGFDDMDDDIPFN
jgi:single-stranded DNA-binding protein